VLAIPRGVHGHCQGSLGGTSRSTQQN
jgi:hypothetical protein